MVNQAGTVTAALAATALAVALTGCQSNPPQPADSQRSDNESSPSIKTADQLQDQDRAAAEAKERAAGQAGSQAAPTEPEADDGETAAPADADPAPASRSVESDGDRAAEPQRQATTAAAEPEPSTTQASPSEVGALPTAQGGNAENDLYFVQALIERSSAAKKVTTSGNPEALAKQEEARAAFLEARRLLDEGKSDAAEQALNRAKKRIFQAARIADQDQVFSGKYEDDYQSRLDSVNALLTAHDRVTEEKGATQVHRDLDREVSKQVERARSLARADEFQPARAVLDKAYLSIKASLANLRGGDTLVRSLDFETKEEEYRYELDRNETLQMLVTVLLDEKLNDPSVAEMVDGRMQEARAIREKAERQAAAEDYGKAIESLESSTRQVIRAIRSAGVYVPG